jgi:Zn finger protein HypA/HybF involved in hydrogenase expression
MGLGMHIGATTTANRSILIAMFKTFGQIKYLCTYKIQIKCITITFQCIQHEKISHTWGQTDK